MEYDNTLSDELMNSNIDFIDGFGDTMFTYNHKNNYTGIGEISDWKEIKLKKLDKNNKYYKISNVNNGFFIGNIEEGIYKNMMAELFTISIKSGFLNRSKKKYLLMIIDNPLFNEDSNNKINRRRYKLIIFSIIRIGIYRIQLELYDILTSTN
jgi:hypothetical protein